MPFKKVKINEKIKEKILNDSKFALEIYNCVHTTNERLREELSRYTDKVYIEDHQEGNQFITVSSCPEGYEDQYGEEPFGNLVDIRMTNTDTQYEMNMYLTNNEALKLVQEILKNIR